MSGMRPKFALGTAQFGLAYGRNLSAPVAGREVADIMAEASARGVELLDTAPAYGNSEQVIGMQMPANANFAVTTKISRIVSKSVGAAEVEAVRMSVKRSLAMLRIGVLDAVLFHHAGDLLLPGGAALFEALVALKAAGKIKRVGVSVYDPEELERLLDAFPIEMVQLPFSLADQRFLESGHLERLHRQKIRVQVRSVFLQGVLLSDYTKLPSRFEKLAGLIAAIDKDAAAMGLSREVFLLRSVTLSPQVSSIVVGVDGIRHLNRNLDAFEEAVASENFPDRARYSLDDPEVIDPRRWS